MTDEVKNLGGNKLQPIYAIAFIGQWSVVVGDFYGNGSSNRCYKVPYYNGYPTIATIIAQSSSIKIIIIEQWILYNNAFGTIVKKSVSIGVISSSENKIYPIKQYHEIPYFGKIIFSLCHFSRAIYNYTHLFFILLVISTYDLKTHNYTHPLFLFRWCQTTKD